LFAGQLSNGKLFERGRIDSGMALLCDNGDALIRREAARLYCRGQPCYAITDDNDIGTVYMFRNTWCVLPARCTTRFYDSRPCTPLRLALELTFVVVLEAHRYLTC